MFLSCCRYQHSKAAQELAEIRRALNSLQTSGPVGQANIDRTGVYKHQNLPLPPIPKKSDLIYQPPSVVSSNSCSTENKYETIGKSLEPYKIEDKNKPKRLPSSTGSSYSSASSRYVKAIFSETTFLKKVNRDVFNFLD